MLCCRNLGKLEPGEKRKQLKNRINMSSSSSKAGDNANDKVNDNSDSNNRPFSALVLGATGAIGAQIAQQLNSLANCVKFTTLHRREPQATLGDKQNAVVVNFDELEASAEAFAGHDVCFCALGSVSSLFWLFV